MILDAIRSARYSVPPLMSITALEKIAAIEADAKNKIEALKQEAVTELVKRIAAAKSELAQLESEYAALTGKTLTGEKATFSRKRLSTSEKVALVETVTGIIKASKEPLSFGDIASRTGESASAVRDAIKQVPGLKVTGVKASTRYALK